MLTNIQLYYAVLIVFFIYYFSSKQGRRIRVQPTSVARRRGNYKGAHRINAGRPPTENYSAAGRHTNTKKKKSNSRSVFII